MSCVHLLIGLLIISPWFTISPSQFSDVSLTVYIPIQILATAGTTFDSQIQCWALRQLRTDLKRPYCSEATRLRSRLISVEYVTSLGFLRQYQRSDKYITAFAAIPSNRNRGYFLFRAQGHVFAGEQYESNWRLYEFPWLKNIPTNSWNFETLWNPLECENTLKTLRNGSNTLWKPPGGGVLGSIFAGYVPLATQNPYPIIVYSVANYRPHFSHFWANVIFAIPT